MSYVNPKIQGQFETLPIELKNVILDRNVQLNSMADLIKILETISAEE